MRNIIFSAVMISGMLFATTGSAQPAPEIVAPTTAPVATGITTYAVSDAMKP